MGAEGAHGSLADVTKIGRGFSDAMQDDRSRLVDVINKLREKLREMGQKVVIDSRTNVERGQRGVAKALNQLEEKGQQVVRDSRANVDRGQRGVAEAMNQLEEKGQTVVRDGRANVERGQRGIVEAMNQLEEKVVAISPRI